MDEQKNIYHAFSTETLERMLRDMTLSEQDLDMDMLDAVMAELDRRQGAPETMDPEAALEVFQTEYAGEDSAYLDCAHVEQEATAKDTPNRRKKSWKRTFLIAAAITVLVAGTLGIVEAASPNTLGGLASWTKERLGFGRQLAEKETAERNAQSEINWPPIPDEDIGPWEEFDYEKDKSVLGQYDSLKELLEAYHVIPELGYPTYIPDGFYMTELQRVPMDWIDFSTMYENEKGQYFRITYHSYEDDPHSQYEKTDAPVEIVDIGDKSFHAFSNSANEGVVWLTAHYDCSVYGTISRDELLKIAESIYFEVD